MIAPDLSQFSMLDLFRVEAETQALVLTSGLLALERDPTLADQLEACMRAAHSLKGAARIVGLAVGVRVAHAMEDCFVAAQQGQLDAAAARTSTCCSGPPTCWRASPTPPEAEIGQWDDDKKPEVDARLAALAGIARRRCARRGTPAMAPPRSGGGSAEPTPAGDGPRRGACSRRPAPRTACCACRRRT